MSTCILCFCAKSSIVSLQIIPISIATGGDESSGEENVPCEPGAGQERAAQRAGGALCQLQVRGRNQAAGGRHIRQGV